MIISCDDGCTDDIRVAELCNKYDIACIFYWPVEWHSLAIYKGYKPLSYNQALDIAKDFEIGSHGVTHRYLTQIRQDEAEWEIEESQFMLQNLFARRISKFAPPRGYTNEYLTKFTEKFYDKQRLTRGEGLVHIHPDSGANDNQDWVMLARQPQTKELWGHSWEITKFKLWDKLEEVLKYASSRKTN